MGACYPYPLAPGPGAPAGGARGARLGDLSAAPFPGPRCCSLSDHGADLFRKGFGLKAEVKGVVEAEYHSALVERIRSRGYQETFGDVTVRLAQEFGFCYGVDRAVDYAYETVHKFPDRRIYLVGEIIHNPHVNRRMTEKGIRFIYPDGDGTFDFSHVTADDVVILPAFGVTLQDFHPLRALGCILVDTTWRICAARLEARGRVLA